jgi:hypothetical protein
MKMKINFYKGGVEIMSSEKQCFICENKTKEYFTCNKTNRVLCESCIEITTSDEWGNDDK